MSPHQSGWMTQHVLGRLYDVLLLVFPRRFRREFGPDLRQLFRDRLRETAKLPHGRLRAQWSLCVRAGGDVMGHALQERFGRDVGPLIGSSSTLRSPQGVKMALDSIRQDLRYGIRSLLTRPGFACIAIVTLALGIGANTAIFSVLNGVLLRPLPFGDPDDLVALRERSRSEGIASSAVGDGLFQDWIERTSAFSSITGWQWDTFVLEDDRGQAIVLDGVRVYPNFFETLQVGARLGRTLVSDDALIGQSGNVVMISNQLWRERWGEDSSIVGTTIRLGGRPVTIVGVMPSGLAAPDTDAMLWMPVGFRSFERWDRYAKHLEVYARLAPGVTIELAQQEMDRVAEENARGEYADIYDGWDAWALPLQEYIVGDIGSTLFVAFAAVGVVLLIACVNLANMLLARATARQREMAMRTALGADRKRLVRQLITESLVLAVGGGVAGVGFAFAVHDLILRFDPGILPRATELSVDGQALVFAFGLSVATGLLFGVGPALGGTRVDVQSALKEGGRGHVGGGSRARELMIAGQVALTVVLVCSAGLLIKSLLMLHRVDPGFDAEGTLAARVFLDPRQYSEEEAYHYHQAVLERLRAIPGVADVGAATSLPMDPIGLRYDLPYRVEGETELSDSELPQADYRSISVGFFEAMRIPIRQGRGFTEFDRRDGQFVTVVNEALAERAWPGESPIGKRIRTPTREWTDFEVIGTVANLRYSGLASDPIPEMYMVNSQVSEETMTFVLRTAGDPIAFADVVRREILAVNGSQPVHTVFSTSVLLSASIASERFYALILGAFALVALTLSGAGVYGVLSYWVNQRTAEIGVRMALGAQRSGVLTMVVRHGMGMTLWGVGVGLLGAFMVTPALGSVLFGVGPNDPITYVVVSGVLVTLALLACWVPAARASRVDPLSALRE